MTIRNILVHVDNTHACAARVSVALEVARDFHASVTGFYCPRQMNALMFADGGASPAIYELEVQAIEAEQASAKQMFDELTKPSGQHFEWATWTGVLHDTLPVAARLQDLVVVGQGDPSYPLGAAAGLAGDLALSGGTPVLVVPPAGAPSGLGDRVVIAWNGSREGARALRDSLPFLHVAKEVHILTVDDEADTLDGVVRYLHHHGIVATPHYLVRESRKVEDGIMAEVARLEGDLLVMGAYGHTRMRELVLGGVTRAVLKDSLVPVFVAH